MIRKLLIAAVVLTAIGCTSSTGEERSAGTSSPKTATLKEKQSNQYIAEEIRSSVTSKRRAKIDKLFAEGPSWFSFKIQQPFENLRIDFVGKDKTYSMVWNTGVDENSKNPLPLQKINQGDFLVDLIVTNGRIDVFFNEGLERFSFQADQKEIVGNLELWLDGTEKSVPGALYDLY